jgi:hypothetical protein
MGQLLLLLESGSILEELVHLDNHLVESRDLREETLWDKHASVVALVVASDNNLVAKIVHDVTKGFFAINALLSDDAHIGASL